MTCRAIQYSDEMTCGPCGLTWATNDPQPPFCGTASIPDALPRGTTVIGLAGEMGAGKDTAGDVLVEAGFTRLKMAGGLKAMLRALLVYRGVAPDMIERYLEGDLKGEPCPALNGRTMRHAMQSLGTEWGRQSIHRDLWVDATRDQVCQHQAVVITDVRFHNEVEMVKELGGQVVRIERPRGAADRHASEKNVLSLDVDQVLKNDVPTREMFQRKVRHLFRHLIGTKPVDTP